MSFTPCREGKSLCQAIPFATVVLVRWSTGPVHSPDSQSKGTLPVLKQPVSYTMSQGHDLQDDSQEEGAHQNAPDLQTMVQEAVTTAMAAQMDQLTRRLNAACLVCQGLC